MSGAQTKRIGSVHICGKLTRLPFSTNTKKGTVITGFFVKQENVVYQVELWDADLSVFAQTLKTGDLVEVYGSLKQTRMSKKNTATIKYNTVVVVADVLEKR